MMISQKNMMSMMALVMTTGQVSIDAGWKLTVRGIVKQLNVARHITKISHLVFQGSEFLQIHSIWIRTRGLTWQGRFVVIHVSHGGFSSIFYVLVFQ
jgi:hypothetical protein